MFPFGQNEKESTPLMEAIEKGSVEKVAALLEAGEDVNVAHKGVWGETHDGHMTYYAVDCSAVVLALLHPGDDGMQILRLVLEKGGGKVSAGEATIRSVYAGQPGQHHDQKTNPLGVADRWRKRNEAQWAKHFEKTGKWERPPPERTPAFDLRTHTD